MAPGHGRLEPVYCSLIENNTEKYSGIVLEKRTTNGHFQSMPGGLNEAAFLLKPSPGNAFGAGLRLLEK